MDQGSRSFQELALGGHGLVTSIKVYIHTTFSVLQVGLGLCSKTPKRMEILLSQAA